AAGAALRQALDFGSTQTAPEAHRNEEQENATRLFIQWARHSGLDELAALFERYCEHSQSGSTRLLNGPTGERNSYSLLPREHVLCLAETEQDLLTQLAAVLAVGSQAVLPHSPLTTRLLERLPEPVGAQIHCVADWTRDEVRFDTVLHHGDADQLRNLSQQLSRRSGPIVGVQGLAPGETDIPLERLLIERALSINTAAAGGNASLMTID
ncbi:MAG: trifunctional transcriptional regulator/proline dehydrogenase/pyrroline-5-carboxylate dehydrogenase, partial [Pseudomonadales bacterium 32-61-5]